MAEAADAVGCVSCLLEDCGLVCRTSQELMIILERLGKLRFSSSIRRHSTRQEAELRIWENNLVPIKKFIYTDHEAGLGAVKSMTPRERALKKLAAGAKPPNETPMVTAAPLEPSTAPDSSRPTSLELRVESKGWPQFSMSLIAPRGILYARTESLICRPEWRTLKVPRSRACAILLDALSTDLGSTATHIRVNTLDTYNTITKFVHGWRRNAGRNARNQEIPDFEIIDQLRTLIDSRMLSVFLSSDAIRSLAVSGSGRPGSQHPETPSGSALSSQSDRQAAGSPLPQGSGGASGPTRKRGKAQPQHQAHDS